MWRGNATYILILYWINKCFKFNSRFKYRLSSGRWSKISENRPLCSNHDDGVTLAIIQCETCQSLCADCDRFLHLSRKTRNHRRTVCKEEEDAIRVELHEGCGRAKLFWLLALADSRSLKAIIEFRDGNIADISSWSRCLMSTGWIQSLFRALHRWNWILIDFFFVD